MNGSLMLTIKLTYFGGNVGVIIVDLFISLCQYFFLLILSGSVMSQDVHIVEENKACNFKRVTFDSLFLRYPKLVICRIEIK